MHSTKAKREYIMLSLPKFAVNHRTYRNIIKSLIHYFNQHICLVLYTRNTKRKKNYVKNNISSWKYLCNFFFFFSFCEVRLIFIILVSVLNNNSSGLAQSCCSMLTKNYTHGYFNIKKYFITIKRYQFSVEKPMQTQSNHGSQS